MKFQNLLNKASLFYNLSKFSMLVHNQSTENISYIVAFASDIWIFNNSSLNKNINELSDHEKIIFDHMCHKLDVPEPSTNDHLYDVLSSLAEFRPDTLHATLYNNKRELNLSYHSTFRLNPQSSVLVKKVVDTLNINNVVYQSSQNEEQDIQHPKYEIQGKLPDELYHGTSLSSAIKILQYGLMPKPQISNYKKQNVIHDKYVFLTAFFDEAQYHAQHAANIKNEKQNNGVVFKFKIPDKSKLIPDYDIDVQSTKTLFNNISNHNDLSGLGDSFKLSQEFAIIGYHGRIPSSFITQIFFIDDKNNSHPISKNDLYKINDFGGEYEAIYYDFEDEDEDEDDEDE